MENKITYKVSITVAGHQLSTILDDNKKAMKVFSEILEQGQQPSLETVRI